MQIIIQPIEKDINNDILNLLSDSISAEFNDNVTVAPTLKVDIQNFIDRNRNQVRSTDLLNWILERVKPTKKEMKILSICDRDAYSGNLNFVFGEVSSLEGQVVAIYLPRLRPEFYNHEGDEQIFKDRIVKEANS
ncbi:MAG TPA: archaemetzincin [Nitrososphaeraceae archaeon]